MEKKKTETKRNELFKGVLLRCPRKVNMRKLKLSLLSYWYEHASSGYLCEVHMGEKRTQHSDQLKRREKAQGTVSSSAEVDGTEFQSIHVQKSQWTIIWNIQELLVTRMNLTGTTKWCNTEVSGWCIRAGYRAISGSQTPGPYGHSLISNAPHPVSFTSPHKSAMGKCSILVTAPQWSMPTFGLNERKDLWKMSWCNTRGEEQLNEQGAPLRTLVFNFRDRYGERGPVNTY